MQSITYEPHNRTRNKTLERTSVNIMEKIKTCKKEKCDEPQVSVTQSQKLQIYC